MPQTYLTPGVYVEELPSGVRAIEGVATSNALFVGFTLRGPVDRATRIASWSEYIDRFGGVTDGSSQGVNDFRSDGFDDDVDYMGHAVAAYFQNGGAVAYIHRLVKGGAKATAKIVQPRTLTFDAANEGSWADGLVVDVTDDPIRPGRHVVRIGRLNDKGELVVLEGPHDDIELDPAAGDDRYLGDILEDSGLVRLKTNQAAATGDPDLPDSAMVGVHRSADVAAVSLDFSGLSADARKIHFRLNQVGGGDAETIVTVEDKQYSSAENLALAIQELVRKSAGASTPAEAKSGFTMQAVRSADEVFLEARSGQRGADSRAVVLNTNLGSTLKFSAAGDLTGKEAAALAQTAVLHNGGDGGPADPAAYTSAFEKLELNPDINVILTPNAAWDADGQPIVSSAIAHCEKMKNRVLIVDPPEGEELTDPVAVNGHNFPTSTYAQLYYPWVRVANPIYDPDLRPAAPQHVLVPPSGFAAGMWARIDGRRGVWKSPAGVEAALLGVDGFEYRVGDPQQQVLNPAGVNVMREKPGYGRVIWGARTLATNVNPEWRYIAPRRTAVMIEEAVRRGIQWAVFEPNDHRLWASLRLNAESFLDGIWRSGGLMGDKASDAYRVSCGVGSTMTDADVERGYVILLLQVALLKPAEFVVIQLQQLVGQS